MEGGCVRVTEVKHWVKSVDDMYTKGGTLTEEVVTDCVMDNSISSKGGMKEEKNNCVSLDITY